MSFDGVFHLAWEMLFGILPPIASYSLFFCFVGGQSKHFFNIQEQRYNLIFHCLEHIYRRPGSYTVLLTPGVYLPHFAYFEKLSYTIKPLKLSLSLEYDILTKAISHGIWQVDVPNNIEGLSDFVWRMTGGANVLVAKALAFITKTITHYRNVSSELEEDEEVDPDALSIEEFYEHFFQNAFIPMSTTTNQNSKTQELKFAESDTLDVSKDLKKLLPTEQVKRMLPTDFWPSGHDVTVRDRRASIRQAKFLANPSTTASSKLPGSTPKSPLAARKLLFGISEPQAVVTKASIYEEHELDAGRPPDRHIHEDIYDIMNGGRNGLEESEEEDNIFQIEEEHHVPDVRMQVEEHRKRGLFYESSDSDDDFYISCNIQKEKEDERRPRKISLTNLFTLSQDRDFGMSTRNHDDNQNSNDNQKQAYTNSTQYLLEYMKTNLPFALAESTTHPFEKLFQDVKCFPMLATSLAHLWAVAVGVWLPCDRTVPISLVSLQHSSGYQNYVGNRKTREGVYGGSAVDVPWPEAVSIAGFQAVSHTFDHTQGPSSVSCASSFHVQIPHLFLFHENAFGKRFGVMLFAWLSTAVRTSWYSHGKHFSYHSPTPPNLKIMLPSQCMYRLLFSLEFCLRVDTVKLRDWLTFLDENHPLADYPLTFCNTHPAILCVSNIKADANPNTTCTAYSTSNVLPEAVTPENFAIFMEKQPVGRLIIADWQERVLCFMKVQNGEEMRFLAICMVIGVKFDSTLDLGKICESIFGQGQGWSSKCTLILFTQDSRQLLVERRRERKLSKVYEPYAHPIGSSCPVPGNVDVVLVNELVYHGFRGISEWVFSRAQRFAHESSVSTDAVGGFETLKHSGSTQVPKDLQSDMEFVGLSLLNFIHSHSVALSKDIPPRPTPPPGYDQPPKSPKSSRSIARSPRPSAQGSQLLRRASKSQGARLSVNFPQAALLQQAISPAPSPIPSDDGTRICDEPPLTLTPSQEYERDLEKWRQSYLPNFFPYKKKDDFV